MLLPRQGHQPSYENRHQQSPSRLRKLFWCCYQFLWAVHGCDHDQHGCDFGFCYGYSHFLGFRIPFCYSQKIRSSLACRDDLIPDFLLVNPLLNLLLEEWRFFGPNSYYSENKRSNYWIKVFKLKLQHGWKYWRKNLTANWIYGHFLQMTSLWES